MPHTYVAMYFRPATEFLGADIFPMPRIEPFEPVGKDGWVFHEKLDDFHVFKMAHTTNIRPEHAFTDGSYHSDFGCSGVVVVPGGLVYGCKPVG